MARVEPDFPRRRKVETKVSPFPSFPTMANQGYQVTVRPPNETRPQDQQLLTDTDRPLVGVLSLQGAYAEHKVMLQKLGAATVEVRTAEELNRCSALIIPGTS